MQPAPPCHQMQHEKLLQKPFLQIKKQAQKFKGIYNVEKWKAHPDSSNEIVAA